MHAVAIIRRPDAIADHTRMQSFCYNVGIAWTCSICCTGTEVLSFGPLPLTVIGISLKAGGIRPDIQNHFSDVMVTESNVQISKLTKLFHHYALSASNRFWQYILRLNYFTSVVSGIAPWSMLYS